MARRGDILVMSEFQNASGFDPRDVQGFSHNFFGRRHGHATFVHCLHGVAACTRTPHSRKQCAFYSTDHLDRENFRRVIEIAYFFFSHDDSPSSSLTAKKGVGISGWVAVRHPQVSYFRYSSILLRWKPTLPPFPSHPLSQY
jgi:hypothetical protein